MLEKYLTKQNFENYDDFYENFKLIVPKEFNFAYDVVDEIALKTPNKTALVWCDENGKEAIFTFKDLKVQSDKVANLFVNAGIKKGDPVILHPRLSSGFEIEHRRGEDMHGTGTFPGVSENGGYAEALVTSVRNIVALPKSLAPKAVAAYADAGLTAYHVAKKASRTLLPGQFVVAIGAGGLGHIGIQCLKAMCAAEIIVVDMSDMALKLAKESGADHVIKADGNEVEAVLQLTKGFGAEAVIDFVGEKGSIKKGLAMTRALGNYYIVGYGEDIQISALDLITTERNIVGNLVGTWADLNELMSLAERGLVHLSTVEYALKDADQALHDLNAGKVKGRAILVP